MVKFQSCSDKIRSYGPQLKTLLSNSSSPEPIYHTTETDTCIDVSKRLTRCQDLSNLAGLSPTEILDLLHELAQEGVMYGSLDGGVQKSIYDVLMAKLTQGGTVDPRVLDQLQNLALGWHRRRSRLYLRGRAPRCRIVSLVGRRPWGNTRVKEVRATVMVAVLKVALAKAPEKVLAKVPHKVPTETRTTVLRLALEKGQKMAPEGTTQKKVPEAKFQPTMDLTRILMKAVKITGPTGAKTAARDRVIQTAMRTTTATKGTRMKTRDLTAITTTMATQMGTREKEGTLTVMRGTRTVMRGTRTVMRGTRTVTREKVGVTPTEIKETMEMPITVRETKEMLALVKESPILPMEMLVVMRET
ncbi:hypothetical protein BU23DRAFT_82990 [Bimuria novae-zelandiae CBS 107.79]|uniref:Uncharacterized protein n=1 Tax=Bimuria novae-zelandiae CBS 107.79 TaxID=1447943 RepID=A0A6A5VG20_9PLEO|nr:hypothetical protein BU23DRAFT_82990 [Bimuria novae-zelandiae CBS 107.79]